MTTPLSQTGFRKSTRLAASLLVVLLAIASGLTLWSRTLERRLGPTTGLLQTLHSTPDFQDPPLLRRRVGTIDLSFDGTGLVLPGRQFSVRWEGLWDVDRNGPTDIHAGGDDRVEVFIDGSSVLAWNGHGTARNVSRTIALAKGLHRLKIEYVQYGGAAWVHVLWAPAGQPPRPFLPESLFADTPDRATLLSSRWLSPVRRGAALAWIVFAVTLVAFLVVGWKRAGATDTVSGAAGHAYRWAEGHPRAGRFAAYVVLAAVMISACLARLAGWNPESLWEDDLVWAVVARAQDFRTMLSLPAHAPPGFFLALWAMHAVFRDPEWSMQLLPFACGIAAIPVMAAVVRRLTQSTGLALLAAALTALNPLLAHYSVFVKQYLLDFLVTALFLLAGASMLDGREVERWKVVRLTILACFGVFFTITSVFTSAPVLNVIALRSWFARRRGTWSILLAAAAFDIFVLVAFFALRGRANVIVKRRYWWGFVTFESFGSVWSFLRMQGRRLIETSLPSWGPTTPWHPETVSWGLPFVGLGLLWLLARRSTRPMGVVVLGFCGAFLLASRLRAYPLGIDRSDIFAFPVAICLFALGLHALTEWMPRRELMRGALGLAAAIFALYAPVHVEYWGVNDERLIRYLNAAAAPADGLILSPDGSYLAAYYGAWPVVISSTDKRSNATEARLVRDRTIYLPKDEAQAPVVDDFLNRSHPSRIWYVDFRSDSETDDVIAALTGRGYVLEEAERTRKGRLYLGIDHHAD